MMSALVSHGIYLVVVRVIRILETRDNGGHVVRNATSIGIFFVTRRARHFCVGLICLVGIDRCKASTGETENYPVGKGCAWNREGLDGRYREI